MSDSSNSLGMLEIRNVFIAGFGGFCGQNRRVGRCWGFLHAAVDTDQSNIIEYTWPAVLGNSRIHTWGSAGWTWLIGPRIAQPKHACSMLKQPSLQVDVPRPNPFVLILVCQTRHPPPFTTNTNLPF
ncbi:hypothetical protein K440DRAFT_611248 [Wilcoxina mikolae CBS 423.85]|nr:hypothetical protein K440DRAFT_611248 [Wilcoxina mikolae CBS 423.85]